MSALWTIEQAEKIFHQPFADLIVQAQQVHRQLFARLGLQAII